MRKMLYIIALVVIAYLVGITLLYFNQERMVFHPDPLPHDRVFHFKQPFQEHFVTAEDGIKLHAIHFHPQGDSKGMVVYYHGNGGSMDRWGYVAEDFTSRGYEVFMTDYRGYGKSGGTIQNQAQFVRDAELFYEYAQTVATNKRMIVVGTSMGSGVAPTIAAKYQPDVLILNTPYNSLLDVTRHHTKGLVPVRWVLKYHFDNEKILPQYQGPVYIIHGTADATVPYFCAERLAGYRPDNTTFITVPDGSHLLGEHPMYFEMLDVALGGIDGSNLL